MPISTPPPSSAKSGEGKAEKEDRGRPSRQAETQLLLPVWAGGTSMRPATNERRLRCPRDGTPLDVGTFHGQPLSKCPTCSGAFFRQRSPLPLLNVLSKDVRDTVPLDYPVETIRDKGGGLACPRCFATMGHYGYMGGRHIMIDSCAACKHIWVDAEELAGMSLLHARSERLAADRRTRAGRRRDAARTSSTSTRSPGRSRPTPGAFSQHGLSGLLRPVRDRPPLTPSGSTRPPARAPGFRLNRKQFGRRHATESTTPQGSQTEPTGPRGRRPDQR
jgi:Zn-finger nucleic acid-binding protein